MASNTVFHMAASPPSAEKHLSQSKKLDQTLHFTWAWNSLVKATCKYNRQQMPAMCFASLLQNKLKSDVALLPPTIINLSNQVVAVWEKLLEKVESI